MIIIFLEQKAEAIGQQLPMTLPCTYKFGLKVQNKTI